MTRCAWATQSGKMLQMTAFRANDFTKRYGAERLGDAKRNTRARQSSHALRMSAFRPISCTKCCHARRFGDAEAMGRVRACEYKEHR